MQKKKVYLVFKDDHYDNHTFCDVFFTEQAAREYISKRVAPKRYNIEVFEETDNGGSKEIY